MREKLKRTLSIWRSSERKRTYGCQRCERTSFEVGGRELHLDLTHIARKPSCINRHQPSDIRQALQHAGYSQSVRRYNLRTNNKRRDYREMVTVELPRPERVGKSNAKRNELYKVEVLERHGDRVRVHYTGYSSSHDEWRHEDDLETLEADLATEHGGWNSTSHLISTRN